MKKVLSLVLALSMVLGSFSMAFATTTADFTEEATFLNEQEILKGSNGDLKLDENLTRQEAYLMVARLLGEEEEALNFMFPSGFADASEIWNWDNVAAWAKGKALTTGKPGNLFDFTGTITFQEVYALMLRAMGKDVAWSDVMTEAAAAGITVDGEGKVTRAQLAGIVVNTLDAEEGKLALSLGIVTPKMEENNVSLEIKSVTAVDLNKIEVKLSKAINTEDAVVKLMRGFANYNVTSEWNEAKDVVTIQSTLSKLSATDYTVVVEGLTEEALTAEITIKSEEAAAIEVATTEVDIDTSAKVYFNVLNQYGTHYTGASTADLSVTLVETISGFTFGAPVLAVSDVKANDLKATFTITDSTPADEVVLVAGDTFKVIAVYEDLTAQAEVTFIDPVDFSDISFGQVAPLEDNLRIFVSQTGLVVPYEAFDQYGNEYELSNLSNFTIVSSNDAIVDDSTFAVVDGEITFDTNSTAGTATITVIMANGTVMQFAVTVEDATEPDSVVLSVPSTLVADGETAELEMVVYNQYGEVIPNDKVSGLTFTTGFAIDEDSLKLEGTVTEDTDFEVTVTRDSDTKELAAVTFAVEAAAEATEITDVVLPIVYEDTATYEVTDSDFTVLDQYGRVFEDGSIVVTSDAAAITVATNVNLTAAEGTATLTITIDSVITKDVDVTVIPAADIVSYKVVDIDPILANDSGNYDVAITLEGVDADGNTVVLASDAPDFITTSNANVAKVVTDTEVQGVAKGTVTISAWKDGKVVDTTTVTVVDEELNATTVTVAVTATAGDTLASLVTVKDQFGVVMSTPGGYFFVDDVTKLGTDTLSAGTVEVKYVSVNGIVKVVDVVVAP